MKNIFGWYADSRDMSLSGCGSIQSMATAYNQIKGRSVNGKCIDGS